MLWRLSYLPLGAGRFWVLRHCLKSMMTRTMAQGKNVRLRFSTLKSGKVITILLWFSGNK